MPIWPPSSALAGDGEIKDAGPKMLAWINANSTSYHYYEACQILGDLRSVLHRYDQASIYYNKLTDSPFPELKMRAGVATGRALLLEKKAAEAQKAFDAVLAVNWRAGRSGRVAAAHCHVGQGPLGGRDGPARRRNQNRHRHHRQDRQ